MKDFIIYPLLLFVLLISCQEEPNLLKEKLSDNWKFKAVEDSLWLAASVPGCVHTDLLDNGIIEDPFYRLNERDLQWIDKKDWEYKTTFVVDKQTLEKNVIELDFKGLDTYAEVYLNEKHILTANNMFLEWIVDCKEQLKLGENLLHIIFKSPIKVGLEKREKLGYLLPGAENDQSELGGLGDKKTCVFTRKAQYHYGWDWGPRLVSSGIWKEIELQAWDNNKIQNVSVVQENITDSIANLIANIELKSADSESIMLIGFIDDFKVFEKNIDIQKGKNSFTIPFNIKNPELWWTNGLGEQKLYSFKVQTKQNERLISTKIQNLGLRTLEVVQEVDSIGKSFYIKLNGHAVFMKGANYIPQDVFLSRVKMEDYEYLIKSAVEANFNMLRVWGGGIYEKDIFYDLCDKYGILVWQDFMFACAMYPGNQEFIDNVETEAIQNVKRLRHHPSIALWCGDNEILSAWNRWGWKENVLENQGHAIVDTVWQAYETIFHHLLPDIIKKYDSQRLYWSSSPSAGFGKLEDGKSGDNHYWGVWWAKEPFSKYKEEIPRFMSEYGFQSFPTLNSVKKYAAKQDWDINSEVMKSHQRSSIGNVTIMEYLKRDYRVPKDFPMFLYVNQVLQAEGIKTAIEAHRKNMPYCMGSLYWQINDCWPVASWSGIDSYGNWKAMHYFVKKAFAQVLLIPELVDENEAEIYVVSDYLEEQKVKLKIQLIDFDGNLLWSESKSLTLKSNTSKKYYSFYASEVLKGKDRSKILLSAIIEGEKGEVLSQNILYFQKIKDLSLPEVNITYHIHKIKGGFNIELSSDKLCKNVFLQAVELEGLFTDNYFDLLPNESVVLGFIPTHPMSLEEFTKHFVVTSLVDSYK